MNHVRVLVVDDDPDVLDLVRARLAQAGIATDGAGSGQEALTRMREHLYVVVVADIHMPDISGVKLVSALKEISPLVQVIMLTADSSIQQVVECVDRGVVDFFAKKRDLTDLAQSIRDALLRIDRWMKWLGLRHTPRAAAPKALQGETA